MTHFAKPEATGLVCLRDAAGVLNLSVEEALTVLVDYLLVDKDDIKKVLNERVDNLGKPIVVSAKNTEPTGDITYIRDLAKEMGILPRSLCRRCYLRGITIPRDMTKRGCPGYLRASQLKIVKRRR